MNFQSCNASDLPTVHGGLNLEEAFVYFDPVTLSNALC